MGQIGSISLGRQDLSKNGWKAKASSGRAAKVTVRAVANSNRPRRLSTVSDVDTNLRISAETSDFELRIVPP